MINEEEEEEVALRLRRTSKVPRVPDANLLRRKMPRDVDRIVCSSVTALCYRTCSRITGLGTKLTLYPSRDVEWPVVPRYGARASEITRGERFVISGPVPSGIPWYFIAVLQKERSTGAVITTTWHPLLTCQCQFQNCPQERNWDCSRAHCSWQPDRRQSTPRIPHIGRIADTRL